MSTSNYKLPHYVYVVFPLVSIITANYINKTFKPIKWEGFGKPIYISQIGFTILLWIAVIFSFILFNGAKFWIYFITYFAFSYFFYSLFNRNSEIPKLFTSTLVTILGVAFVLNTHFYPSLNAYQGRVLAGKYLKENKIDSQEIIIFPQNVHKPTIDVYSDMLIPRTQKLSVIDSIVNNQGSFYIFTNDSGLDSLKQQGCQIIHEKVFKDYQISLLSLPFLNPKTRESVLNNLYLIKVVKR